MSLVGNLEDLGLGEILQIVSLSRRSGVLSLESRGREARVIFRNGQVIRATSTTFQQNLGEVLIQKGVIDLATLKRALSIQAEENFTKLLGVILIDRFGISHDDIESVVREQIENVVYSLFAWAEGTFEFELQEVADGDGSFEGVQFMLKQGLNPQYLAMEGSRIIDEQRHRAESGEGEDEELTPEENVDFAFDLLQETPAASAETAQSDQKLPPAGLSEPAAGGQASAAVPPGHEHPFAAADPFAHAADPFAHAAVDPFAAAADPFASASDPFAAAAADPFAAAADSAAAADLFATGGDQAAAAALQAAQATEAASQQAPSLVLVDDDPETLEVLTPLLEGQGYRVHAVERSEDALIRVDNLYRDGARPTVVLDLIMPRMDGTGILGGLELMELLRNNFPELPVLALSDFPNDEAQRKSRGMGAPVLMKPAKAELQEALDAFRPALFAAISKVEAGAAGTRGNRVNIGDELRLEMGEEPALQAPHIHQSVGVSQLRGMLEELNNPHLGGGIILLVLRFAAEFMNRGVVLLVKKDSIQGLGQFGLDDRDGSADARVRSLRIPRDEATLFRPVLETRFTMKGPAEDLPGTRLLLEQLGGGHPSEVFVGPIISEGKVVAVLYGDNLPEQKAIGDTESLEIFLSQAGLAMEKALLQRRLQDQGRGEN